VGSIIVFVVSVMTTDVGLVVVVVAVVLVGVEKDDAEFCCLFSSLFSFSVLLLLLLLDTWLSGLHIVLTSSTDEMETNSTVEVLTGKVVFPTIVDTFGILAL
jgi:hypothetical protein